MSIHYAIGDLHLADAKVLTHDNRPWPDIQSHDIALIDNCVSVGRPNRTLWLLGDVARKKPQLLDLMHECRGVWGKIMLIRGNHDDKIAWRHRDLFDEAHEALYLRINTEVRFYMSHYAHRVWRNSHRGAFHIHAHSHGALPRWGRSADVGAPCVNYTPPALLDIAAELKDLPLTPHH